MPAVEYQNLEESQKKSLFGRLLRGIWGVSKFLLAESPATIAASLGLMADGRTATTLAGIVNFVGTITPVAWLIGNIGKIRGSKTSLKEREENKLGAAENTSAIFAMLGLGTTGVAEAVSSVPYVGPVADAIQNEVLNHGLVAYLFTIISVLDFAVTLPNLKIDRKSIIDTVDGVLRLVTDVVMPPLLYDVVNRDPVDASSQVYKMWIPAALFTARTALAAAKRLCVSEREETQQPLMPVAGTGYGAV